MNHALENALIAALLLTCFIVPAIIIMRKAAGKQRRLLEQGLENMARQYNLKITRSETIGNRMLGWDEHQHTLIYLDNLQEPALVFELQPEHRCVYTEELNNSSVRLVALQLTDVSGRILEQLTFYRQFQDNEMKLKSIISQTQAWEAFINQQQLAVAH